MGKKAKEKVIKWLGGYTKDEVLTVAVKHLYNTIDEDDILKENRKGEWTIGERVVDDGVKRLIISEAKTILAMRTWQILQKDIKYRANKMMFEKSKTEADLMAGKFWLYTIDAINTRLDSLSRERGVFKA